MTARAVLTMLALSVFASDARAFSDAKFFADAPLEGGGDGRYFTGSPRDPFSCSVCHQGAAPPDIAITGLPEALVPGERHDVLIRWTKPELSHALTLELMTEGGGHAPIDLGALEELPAASRCDQNPQSDPAVYTVDVGERRVVGVQDCGASELRFSFEVPDAPVLYFAMGIVRSDSSGTPDGDGVVEVRRKLERGGASSASDGCSVRAPSHASPEPAVGVLMLAIAAAVLARRRHASAKLEARRRRQLERADVRQPDEREVAQLRDRGARAQDQRELAAVERRLVRERGAGRVRVERGQLAVARREAVAALEVEVARPVEGGLGLRVIAVAQGQRAAFAEPDRDVGLQRVRSDAPRVDVQPVLEAGRQALRKRVAPARGERVPEALVGDLLGDAERRDARARAVAAERDEAVDAGLEAADTQRLPRELDEIGARQHLRERGTATEAVLALLERRVAGATDGVDATERVQRERRVVAREIEAAAEHAAVRDVVLLGREAVAAGEHRVVERVARAGAQLVARLVDRLRRGGAHVDRGAGPGVHRVRRLELHALGDLAGDVQARRDHGRAIAVGAHVRGRGGFGDATGERPARHTEHEHERTHGEELPVQQGRQYTAAVASLSTLLGVVVVAAGLSGCYRPSVSASELDDGDAAAPFRRELDAILSERAGAQPDAQVVECDDVASAVSELQLSVRTISGGGRFRPRNAGAIWIEDDEGAWVKTLERWGERRAKWLTVFNEASGGDVTDAITSATLPMHRVHDVTWDLTDRNGCAAPDGAYVLRMELTDWSGTGENASLPFEKREPFATMPDDVAVFRDMTLRLQ